MNILLDLNQILCPERQVIKISMLYVFRHLNFWHISPMSKKIGINFMSMNNIPNMYYVIPCNSM